MMFESVQTTYAVPNILLSVLLLAFIIAGTFFTESWLSSREGDFANRAADQGLRHSALGARALCGSSGSRKAQKKHLSWGGQAGKSPREPPTRTSIEPETHRGHQEPERRLSWWERTVGFQRYPTNRRKRLGLMCRLLPGWPDNRTSFLLQVTDNVN